VAKWFTLLLGGAAAYFIVKHWYDKSHIADTAGNCNTFTPKIVWPYTRVIPIVRTVQIQ
jgi:hypothetical protein